MAGPQKHRLELVRGDAHELIVSYVDSDSVAIDISGETVVATFYDDETVILTLTDGSGLTVDGPNGLITLDVTSDQVEDLVGLTDVYYKLQLTTSETTILIGRVNVWEPVWQ